MLNPQSPKEIQIDVDTPLGIIHLFSTDMIKHLVNTLGWSPEWATVMVSDVAESVMLKLVSMKTIGNEKVH